MYLSFFLASNVSLLSIRDSFLQLFFEIRYIH